MSFIWYNQPEFKAPYRSDTIKESCELAYEYFSMILDDFIARLPEYRQPIEFVDWIAEEHTLADRVHLIFPNGFGEWDEQRNHNPYVWPWFVMLSDCVHDDTIMVMEYANVVSKYWSTRLRVEKPTMKESLHTVFDFFTAYLQLFVGLTDTDSLNQDFKFPPEDECGNLVGVQSGSHESNIII